MMNFVNKSLIKDLEYTIQDAAQKYYTDGTSPYSDFEFDLMVDQLRKLDPKSKVLRVGWGYDVWKDTTSGAKYEHKYGEVGSLKKVHNWKEIPTSYKYDTSYVDISLKLDGLSVVLYYIDGKFKRALTRGNGTIGIDISDKIIYIFNHRKKSIDVGDHFTGAVRGEILMSYEDFNKFKSNHDDAKNPRNSTAGLINMEGVNSDLDYLNIIFYTIVGNETDDSLKTLEDVRLKLRVWYGSNNVVPYKAYMQLSSESYFNELMNFYRDNWYGVYPADGLVLTMERIICGGIYTDGSSFYDAYAFKFPSEVKESEVEYVEWNLSKNKYLVPRVKIKPIELAGTTVEWCTGYNAQYIKDNTIGKGAFVTVEKRGEIIPNINEVKSSSLECIIPNVCPDCGATLVWSGVNLKCPNESCGNSIIQDTLIWFHKLVPQDGLGDKLIVKFLYEFVDGGILEDVSIESIMECDYIAEEHTNSAQFNKFAVCWNKLHGLWKFDAVTAIEACNIPRFGTKTAEKMARYVDLTNSWIKYASSYINQDPRADYILNTIESDSRKLLGNANVDSLIQNISKFYRIRYIWKRVMRIKPNITSESKPEEIVKVAITGKLSVSRSKFEEQLKSFGFEAGSITKDTKYLITDDPTSNSSKNQKADKYGIEKITESDFRDKFMK